MSHSPWKVTNVIEGGSFVRVAAGGPVIAIFQGSDNPAGTREMAIANAKLACRAVNAHAQIAALCESAETDDEKIVAFHTIAELVKPTAPIDLERGSL